MGTDQKSPNLDIFYDLLDQERALIFRGEIEMLTRLLPQKKRLLDSLEADGLDPLQIEGLQSSFEQNQQLLRAVLEGIRAASSRLRTIERGDGGLRTYTKNGSSNDLSRRESQLELKA